MSRTLFVKQVEETGSLEEFRGCSSVGRAVALQAIGQEFESPQLHQLLLAARTRLRATLASSGRELRPAKSVFSRSGV